MLIAATNATCELLMILRLAAGILSMIFAMYFFVHFFLIASLCAIMAFLGIAGRPLAMPRPSKPKPRKPKAMPGNQMPLLDLLKEPA